MELWCVLLGELFGVDVRLRVFLFDLVALLVNLLRLWRRLLRRDVEHFECRLVANRVAIENITTVLAVVLTESPPDGLTHHLCGDLLFIWVFLVELVDADFEVEHLEVIV